MALPLIYQFKVSLKRSKPNIWRRLLVPKEYNFWELHVAIQDAMGWGDCHLHRFYMKKPDTGENVMIGIPSPYDGGFFELIHEKTTKISDYFVSVKDKARYEYDFGDSWNHDIVLQKIFPAIIGNEYPQCVAGRRACPPENCGGIDGYKDLLDFIQNPDLEHDFSEEDTEWLEEVRKGKMDPAEFDPKSVYFDDPEYRWPRRLME